MEGKRYHKGFLRHLDRWVVVKMMGPFWVPKIIAAIL